jgi:hypothetical protein
VLAGLTTLGLRSLFADFIASFMALAPVRSANRAMALNERWSDRLTVTTYGQLAHAVQLFAIRAGIEIERNKKVLVRCYRQVSDLAHLASVGWHTQSLVWRNPGQYMLPKSQWANHPKGLGR